MYIGNKGGAKRASFGVGPSTYAKAAVDRHILPPSLTPIEQLWRASKFKKDKG